MEHSPADLDELFARLSRSSFRRKFRLFERERAYLERWGLSKVMKDGRLLILERLAPAHPRNDGRQTPWRNHPIFIAQHATATCCRGCLEKWHGIGRGRTLDVSQVDYVLAVLRQWLSPFVQDELARCPPSRLF